MAEQPEPGWHLLHGLLVHKNSSSACAAAGCRQSWPCCATGPKHPRARHARQHRIPTPHTQVRRQVTVAHHGADAQAALCRVLDAVQPQPVHIDQMHRCFHLQLHQVKQIGAAGNKFGARVLRHRLRGGFGGGRSVAFSVHGQLRGQRCVSPDRAGQTACRQARGKWRVAVHALPLQDRRLQTKRLQPRPARRHGACSPL